MGVHVDGGMQEFLSVPIETIIELRKIQPDVMFRARGIGDYGDYTRRSTLCQKTRKVRICRGFVIYPLGHGFSYGGPKDKYKGIKWIIRNFLDIIT